MRLRHWSTHLDRRSQSGSALLQDIGEVFARMLPSAEVQRDLPPAADRYDAAGEGSRASVVPAARHLQYPHAGVIVMHHTALRRLPDELAQHGFERLRGCLHQLPL